MHTKNSNQRKKTGYMGKRTRTSYVVGLSFVHSFPGQQKKNERGSEGKKKKWIKYMVETVKLRIIKGS